jgi:hypothetical protein
MTRPKCGFCNESAGYQTFDNHSSLNGRILPELTVRTVAQS